MNYICYILLGYGLGVFSVVFFIAWLDEREDAFCNIVYKKDLDTCIEWSTRLQGLRNTLIVVDSTIPKKISMKNYRTDSFRYKKNVALIKGL